MASIVPKGTAPEAPDPISQKLSRKVIEKTKLEAYRKKDELGDQ
jgi:hypothetical protein